MFVRSFLSAAVGFGALASANAAAPARTDTAFMEFPLASELSGAEAPAFAWLVRKGSDSIVMFAEGPDFKPVKLFSQADVDGQPVTAVRLSADGRHVLFQTGSPFAGGRAYNPASLLDPPKPSWWLTETRVGAKPVPVSPGASFSPDGRQLLLRKDRDILAQDLDTPDAKTVVVAPGAAALGRPVWSADRKTLYFAQDRGGYSFLGQYRLGSDRIDWLVTGADRLTAPTLSPDGKTIAYLRFPGRDHDTLPDYTESEPFALETVDIATGTIRELWHSTGKASAFGIDDPDSQIRWIGNGTLLFYSEQDGWARYWSIPAAGGAARAVTPPDCEAAESELIGADTLVVSHNCHGIDTRQISFFDARSGAERPLKSADLVMADVALAGSGRYVGYVGGDADNAPLVRVYDTKTSKVVMAERSSDYGFSHAFTAPPPRAVRVPAADGGTVPAQLFLPSTKGPHPALVYVHGGPPRQMFPAFHYMGYYAADYAANRRLAELGYVVVSINYRSGIGYGRDYREAPKRGWRGASEYADVLGAGRWLAARDDVDRDRIGIWGGSYGGLLTAQALARNSDLFKAGVAIHGVYDWSWPSPKEGHQNPSRLFGVGPNDRAEARAASPVAFVDGWRSPVLLFSGDQDMNVDVLETVDLSQKLRAQGVDVRTVLIPGEAHDFVRHSTWQRLWDEQQKFLAEKLDTAK